MDKKNILNGLELAKHELSKLNQLSASNMINIVNALVHLIEKEEFEKIEQILRGKQMTAKEMFEKLGYKIEHNDEDNLYYVNDGLLIQFDLIYREYCVYFKNNEIASISCEEHKAITQQLNELGWLDD